MRPDDVREVLSRPLARALLTSRAPARLAYVARDGTPRVVPIGHHWDGAGFLMFTAPGAPKVRALEARPQVALTLDTEGFPPRALLVRGTARLGTVEGVPEEFLDASAPAGAGERAAFAAEARALYRRMTRIAVTPEWAKLLDFETTLPSALEELAAARDGGG
ncbi:Pyridoxamine 5'-phosphate oxidase [Streptomyces zhaozhouensis]|uniref:Pyridoxamine 5'-phosphate oxidase n=1 Tax=Streptomyces zhaozhouensis TaxID=1300267 RepID=A0A286DZK2_9ACTN|nr:pyridoxamine 5'-phosphate oxidase family protein [Streptomyces zhaozhouensis]SOD64086.1 Pyridoxamine 5'-phosphate oxidase [Streptomyces zhaozhouensis]